MSPSDQTNETTNEPTENPSDQTTETTTTQTTSSPEHDLNSFRVADRSAIGGDDRAAIIEADDTGKDQAVANVQEEEKKDPIGRDAFWETWKVAWSIPGDRNPDFKKLAAQDNERPAVDAIYRLLEIWYPKALIPQSETITLLFAAGPVLYTKALIVREVLADRRARQLTPPTRQEQADGATHAPTSDGNGWMQ